MKDAPSPTTPTIAEFEAKFEQETRDLLGYRFRVSFTVGIVLYLAFSGLDWFFAREHWGAFLALRVIVAGIAGFGIWLSRTEWGERNVLPLSFATLSVASLVLSAMTAMLDGFSSGYFYGNMLVLFLVGLFMPWRPAVTLTFCSLVTCGYFIVNLWAHSIGLEAVLPFFFLLGTCALTFLGSAAIERSRRIELMQRMELEKAKDELAELDKTKTAFFANVSHELRTPLMLILGPLEQMLSGQSDRDPRPMLESMDLASRRLLKQINTILDFSKLEAGGQELSLQQANVGEVLLKLVRAAEPLAERHALRLETKGLDELPNSLFDLDKVETIGSNLLGNALKFTGDGGRVIVRGGVEDSKVWFEVEDTGVGIEPGQLNKVFDRFHQVSGTRSGKVQGTGLGLSLAREFAREHGGEISVSSVPKVGTTFRVELPMEPVAASGVSVSQVSGDGPRELGTAPREDEAPATLAEGRMSQTAAEKSKGRTTFADLEAPRMEQADAESLASLAGEDAPLVLVVEDNDDMRALISNTLSQKYRVVTACNGEEGLLEARRSRPDLIVSDVMMPKMDGTQMLKLIREGAQTRDIPVILVTARTGAESVVHGLATGATDYVTKPFQFSELLARIDAQLRVVRTRRVLDERETRLAALGGRVAQIAHDLRSPLTAVVLRTESLRMTLEEAEKRSLQSGADLEGLDMNGNEDLLSIRSAVKRASGMTTELMDFVRGRETQIQREDVRMLDFVKKVTEEVKQSLDAAEIELVLEVDPPELRVSMDRERMMRVIENLVNNARDALRDESTGRAGRIWLQAYTHENQIVIRVADNGPGILPEIRDSLFQPFHTAGKADGTGLGLAIATNIVEAHGGTLRAEDKPPEGGAAFRITLDRDQSFWEELVQATE